MKIAHFRRVFSPLTETFIYDYVRAVDQQPGCHSHVVCLQRVNAADRPWPLVHRAPPPPAWAPWRLSLDAADRLMPAWHGYPRRDVERIRMATEPLRPDVIHAHFGPDGVLAAEVADALGRPLVVSYHGYDISILIRQPVWMARYRRLWEQARALTVVSRFQRQRLLEMGVPQEKVHVVRVGKRMADYPFTPPADRPFRELLSIGRAVEKKGHDDLLEALALANAQLPPGRQLRLTLVGDGPLTGELEALATRLGLSDQVRFAGAVPHEEVVALLRRADGFALASRTARDGDEEGVPTVLMEAQAMGLVCVSTTHTGIPEVFAPQHRDRLLAAPGDRQGLAERLVALAQAPHGERVALAEAGRAHVEGSFDLDRQAARLVEIYREVRGAWG